MKNLALLAMLSLTAACSSAAFNLNAATNTNVNGNANREPQDAPIAAAGESQSATAEALVADLYKAHDANKSPFFQTKNRALVDKYFTKSLADLIWKDATTTPKGEEGAIGADPLYDAQDTQIKNFAVGHADVKGDSATVAVTFTNFADKQTIIFHLKLVGTDWKIDDIEYGGEAGSLRKWFKESAIAANSGMFAGQYKVGDTTCTIKPSKMAYELRWAKGSGVEMLFSNDNKTFESDPAKGGGVDRFVFDDDTLNTGTFYRADGKTMPVKRIG